MYKIKTSDVAPRAAMRFKSTIFDHLNRGNVEMLLGVVYGMYGSGTNNYIILQGCDVSVSGPVVTITSGYIFKSGAIYKVNSSSITLGGGEVVIGTITPTFPFVGSGDPTLFTDNINYNILEVDNIVLSAGTSGSGSFNLDDAIYLNDTWHEVGASGEPSYENSYTAASSGTIIGSGVAFKKQTNGKVSLKGGISKSPLTTSDVFTLPTSYRPTYNKSFLAMSSDVGGINPCLVKITAATGKVNVTPLSPSGLGVISFEGLSYFI